MTTKFKDHFNKDEFGKGAMGFGVIALIMSLVGTAWIIFTIITFIPMAYSLICVQESSKVKIDERYSSIGFVFSFISFVIITLTWIKMLLLIL